MKKPTQIRNEHDVIRFMGCFPDKITYGKLEAKVWKCSRCKNITNGNGINIEIPSPCYISGGICFEALNENGEPRSLKDID